MAEKILIAFDFDKTIVQDNTDMVIFDMIKSREEQTRLWDQRKDGKWTEFMNNVVTALHRNNCSIAQMKARLSKMDLMDGMDELFCYIKEHLHIYDCIITSDSNSYFIETILEEHNLKVVFKKVLTNKATVGSDGKLEILPCHTHNHQHCPINMCKGLLLKTYIENSLQNDQNYKAVIYIGDGSNDFCPCVDLRLTDYAFPRKGFPLETKIQKALSKKDKTFQANVFAWVTGIDILSKLKLIKQNVHISN